MAHRDFFEILQKAENRANLSAAEILSLLAIGNTEEEELLRQTADRVRKKYVGEEVHLRGIIEFSNHCTQNCLYCGLRRDNLRLPRYRMTPAEILETAERVREEGIQTVVLQSGEDPGFTGKGLAELIGAIKRLTGLAITLSVGERSCDEMKAWREAGADRYLLKQETASPALFRYLRPGRELSQRLEQLKWLKELDYEVGSGNMVGLPGQTDADLAEDIFLFKENDYDMIGTGPFIAHPQSPLSRAANGRPEKVLRVLAVTRILTGDTHLPATTATGILSPEGRRKALLGGANVIMPDMTPDKYRPHYDLYPGRTQKGMDAKGAKDFILSLGRTVGRGPGGRKSRPPIPAL
jgi:biotin synthase